MKLVLFFLISVVSIQSYSKSLALCSKDTYTTNEINEFEYNERMKVFNKKGETVGSLIFGNENVDGVFLCGLNGEAEIQQAFFGLLRNVSYYDLLEEGAELNKVKPYVSEADTHTVEFYNAKTSHETEGAYFISVNVTVKSMKTNKFVLDEEVVIELRKENKLYE